MDYKRICRKEKREGDMYLYRSIRKRWLMKLISVYKKEEFISAYQCRS